MAWLTGLGLGAVAWVAWGFVGSGLLPLGMTLLIGAVYGWGVWELWRFDHGTRALHAALVQAREPVADLPAWLERLPAGLRAPVRQRIEGERTPLPAPGLTPYLVGLLVMLGMLGTFVGMVATFKGAVFALQGSTNLDAIRSALAAPIQGLGLSFGTSVAGVASSAMLGLLSALCRRERQHAVRALDGAIATSLRAFSAAQQREDLHRALCLQAQAMPQIVQQLQALGEGLARQQQTLGTQLLEQERGFHAQASASYEQLARSVGDALQHSLVGAARLAADTLRPIVENAMAELAQQAQHAHQRQHEAAQAQQQALSSQWQGSAQQVRDTWLQALAQQQDTQQQLLQRLDTALQQFTHSFAQDSARVLDAVQTQAAHSLQAQAQAEQQRQQNWNEATQAWVQSLGTQWQQWAERTAQQQAQAAERLQHSLQSLGEQVDAHCTASTAAVARTEAQAQALEQARAQAEARWLEQHQQRTDQLTAQWHTDMAALREDEGQRAAAAVQRLDALQAAVAQHLATLGAALEAPLTQLLHTASEVPRSAADVIAQLRQEMARLGERDNAALAERHTMVERMAAVLNTVEQASTQQRAAIDTLVHSATAVLEQAAQRFAQGLDAQRGQVDAVGAQVQASAIDLASAGEAFQHGMGVFSESNRALTHSLQALHAGLEQSLARSDEQLAYYVAQAREVIDLSISSQHSLVEDLRRLHAQSREALA
ncbi:MAG: DUF802 domain-containing protein [Rhodoferax sp.]